MKNDKTAKIDELIAAAQAAKAKRAPGEKPPKPPKAAKKQDDPTLAAEKAQKLAEREAAKAKREADRAVKKGERETAKAAKKLARDAKRAEKLAARKPAHLAKLEKAKSKLPGLTEIGWHCLRNIEAVEAELDAGDLLALAEHLAFKARSMQTVNALTTKLEEGSSVRVLTGKFTGQVGKVEKASRIRCHVRIPGVEKIAYLFTSDVEVVEAETLSDEQILDGVAEAVG